MIVRILFYLTCLLVLSSLIQAKSCPCELVVNESDKSTIQSSSSVDDDVQQESKDKFHDLTNLYPFVRQIKRLKRPSWATIGKRSSSILIKKRPSWAQIG